MNATELFQANDTLRDEITTAEKAKDYALAKTLFLRRLAIGRQITDLTPAAREGRRDG